MTIQSRARTTSFLGDVLKLVGGTGFAQALSILVSPILTRLYSPEAFGVAALFVSITAIIGEIVCLRYDLAVVLPETDEEAANLFGVSVGSALAVSLATVLVVWLGQAAITAALNAPEIAPFLWLIPPAVFIDGLFTALNAWNTRAKLFGRLSVAQAVTAVVASGTKIAAGLAGYATGGAFIATNVLGSATATTILGGQIWRDDARLFRRSIRRQAMLAGLKRYYKFPVYSTWTGLVNSLSWQLPALMLSAFFSPAVAGLYALGNRLVRMPMMLIGKSITQVFYQRAAEAHATGNLAPLVQQVYSRLVAYSLFPMLLLTLIGEELFAIVFGNEWAEAGVYSQILSVYMFFNFISSPLSQLFNVLEKQEASLVVNALLLASRLGALWLGGSSGDVVFTLTLFSATGVVVYGGCSMWIVHAAGVPLKDWWLQLLRWALTSTVFLAPAWLLSTTLNLQAWGILATYGVCAVAYFAWVLSQDKQIARLAHRLYLRLPWVHGK